MLVIRGYPTYKQIDNVIGHYPVSPVILLRVTKGGYVGMTLWDGWTWTDVSGPLSWYQARPYV